MLAGDARQAVTDLARSALTLRPFALAGYPLRVPCDPAAAEVVATIGASLDIALLTGLAEQQPLPLDWIVTERLRSSPALSSAPLEEVGALVAQVRASSFESLRCVNDVAGSDGVPLRCYAAGEPDRPVIVIASACGMPAALCEPWMRLLADDYFVVTWETRGMFDALDDTASFDSLDTSVEAQGRDLLAVIDEFSPGAPVHVMGLCGGAVIALSAAAHRTGRVASLSLWHGDFSGSRCPTSEHQQNLKALLAMARMSRDDAALINTALRGTAMSAVPEDVAHLVVYPYLNHELFYRYCALTEPTMTIDSAPMLPAVTQPCLVVTSEDDHTAHPGGSHAIAAALPDALLRVEPHGDHISVFSARQRLRQLLTEFLVSLNTGGDGVRIGD